MAKCLLNKLQLFESRPDLASKGTYAIKSEVEPNVLVLFFSRIMGDKREVVTTDNAEQLQNLCDELGFSGFDGEIRAVLGGDDQRWMSSRIARFFQVQEMVDDHEIVLDEILVSLRSLHAMVDDLKKEVAQLKEAQSKLALSRQAAREGIIAQLTRECGGNVHKKGVVKVTASSCFGGCEPENAVDLWQDSQFWSQNEPNSWICYDFGGRRVVVTKYSITSTSSGSRRKTGSGSRSLHPKSWVLEISKDGSEGSWVVVDRREKNFDLNYPSVTRKFGISTGPGGAFPARFARLRQTGENHNGDDRLVICALELFGELLSNDEQKS